MENLLADKIVDFLCKVPGLEKPENRDILLRNIPKNLVSVMSRFNAQRTDVTVIIDYAKQWGYVGDRKKLALEIILDNSLPFVQGTTLEAELKSLKKELSNSIVPPDSKEFPPQSLKDLLFQLNEAEKARNFQKVIDLGTRILEINVQHQPTRSQTAAAYRLRGISYYDRSDYDKAIEDFDRAIDLNPEKANSYYQRARVYHKKSEWDRVIADCDRAIKLKSEADYYDQRGRAYHNKGDYDRAITDSKRAIQIDRRKADYHYLQGLSLHAKGNSLILPPQNNYNQAFIVYDQAIDALNEAIKLNPDEAIRLNPDKVANYYWIRGLCHLNRSRYDLAINDFNRANELDPKQTIYDHNFLLGISYASKHDYISAIWYLTLAIGFLNESKNANYSYQRSLSYYNRGDNKEGDYFNALKDINRAIELSQFNWEYLKLKNMIEDRLPRGR